MWLREHPLYLIALIFCSSSASLFLAFAARVCKKNERERNIRKGSERREKLRSEEDSFKKSMIKGGECVTIWLRVAAALISIQIKVNWSVGLSLSLLVQQC